MKMQHVLRANVLTQLSNGVMRSSPLKCLFNLLSGVLANFFWVFCCSEVQSTGKENIRMTFKFSLPLLSFWFLDLFTYFFFLTTRSFQLTPLFVKLNLIWVSSLKKQELQRFKKKRCSGTDTVTQKVIINFNKIKVNTNRINHFCLLIRDNVFFGTSFSKCSQIIPLMTKLCSHLIKW